MIGGPVAILTHSNVLKQCVIVWVEVNATVRVCQAPPVVGCGHVVLRLHDVAIAGVDEQRCSGIHRLVGVRVVRMTILTLGFVEWQRNR